MPEIKTKSGLKISKDFERIVHGGRGDYIEISKEHIIHENIHIPSNQEWRLNYIKCYYIEYRSNDICNVKIYFQKKKVSYADYKIGYFYISPDDVVCLK